MGVFRVALVGKINGSDETRNVFTFFNAAAVLPSAAEVAAWLDTLYTNDNRVAISNIWSAERWIIEEPDIAGHWEYRKEGAYLKAGAHDGESAPQQIASVIIGVTPSRRRGKKFLPCVPEQEVNNGILQSAQIVRLQAFADAWILPMTVGGATAASGVCKSDGTDFLAFNSARVDHVVGTQRRRKQGVGS